MRIGFIGLGNMAGAIIRGLRKTEAFIHTDISGFDHNDYKGKALNEEYGIRILPNAGEVAKACDVLLLAVKPQGMGMLLEELKGRISEKHLLISLAAGKTLNYYAGFLGELVPLVLAMPNINAKVGASCTALCANQEVTPKMMEQAAALFGAIGSVTVLPEEKLPVFSAIAGAGPAFAYLFIDALTSAGIKAGLPRRIVQQAACEMLEGSARLVQQSGEHPRSLIDQVTSPGGTTIEGMHKLAEFGFEHAVHEAVNAVIEKNKRMK
jgi:pyrroline-5-carboxylate reductase